MLGGRRVARSSVRSIIQGSACVFCNPGLTPSVPSHAVQRCASQHIVRQPCYRLNDKHRPVATYTSFASKFSSSNTSDAEYSSEW